MSRFLGAFVAVLTIGIEWLSQQDEARSRQHYESLASSERMQAEAEYWRGEAYQLRRQLTEGELVRGEVLESELVQGYVIDEGEFEVTDA